MSQLVFYPDLSNQSLSEVQNNSRQQKCNISVKASNSSFANIWFYEWKNTQNTNDTSTDGVRKKPRANIGVTFKKWWECLDLRGLKSNAEVATFLQDR